MTRLRALLLTAIAFGCAGAIGVTQADAATTMTVTTTANNGPTGGDCATTDTDCSLRQAFYTADGRGTVTIALPAGTYLTSGVVSQNAAITLSGAGASSTIIDGSGSTTSAALIVNSGSLTADGVTIQNGADTGVTIAAQASATFTNTTIKNNSTQDNGGGIAAYGALTLDRDRIVGNVANASSQGGGGIYVGAVANRTNRVTITNTTISGNQAQYGGGIEEFQNGTSNATTLVSIAGSLITGNTALQTGGGFQGPGATATYGSVAGLTITSTTVEGNTAGAYGGGLSLGGQLQQRLVGNTIVGNTAQNGGDIAVGGSPGPTLQDTIVAGGTASGSGPDCTFVSAATLTTLGSNLDDKNGCLFKTASGDLINTDPALGPLADNGGPTQTHAPALGSPAIDGGGATCPATDQRGVTAPQGAACDIGAYESALPSIASTTATLGGAGAANVTASVANPDAAGATVTVKWGTSAGAYTSSAAPQTAGPLTGASDYVFGLSGLQAGTTYHYVVSVKGARGTVSSADGLIAVPAPTTSVPGTPLTTPTAAPGPGAAAFGVAGLHVTTAGKLTATLTAHEAGTFGVKATFGVTSKVKVRKNGKVTLRKKTVTTTVGTATVTASGAGTYGLTVTVSKTAARKLTVLKHAKVTVAITFTPKSGGPVQKNQPTLTVHRSRSGHYS